MAISSSRLKSSKALKRLRTLRSVYEKPQAVRKTFGLKRRKLSASQKFLRALSPH